MISYVTLGTNDLERALKFYDAVLGELGVERGFKTDRLQFYIKDGFTFAVGTPFNGEPATGGNGTMISFTAPDRAAVDKIYATALANGGSDEGAPGERAPTAYGAYFRDLDGNKLAIFKMG